MLYKYVPMSDKENKANLKSGTNSFYCTDDELLAQANEMIENSDQFRSVSHFLTVCLREKVDGEKSNLENGIIDVQIEREDLANYVLMKHNEGEFFDERHVVTVALERMKEDDKGQVLV